MSMSRALTELRPLSSALTRKPTDPGLGGGGAFDPVAAYVASGAIPGSVEVALKLEVSGGVPVPIDMLRMDKPTTIHNPTETAISVIAVRPALTGGYSVGVKAIT